MWKVLLITLVSLSCFGQSAWHVETSLSPMADKVTLLSMDSSSVYGIHGIKVTPSLMLSCAEGTVNGFFVTFGTPVSGADDRFFTIRFDNDHAIESQWRAVLIQRGAYTATGGEPQDAGPGWQQKLRANLLGHSTLIVQFTPVLTETVEYATFDLTGLKPLMDKHPECGPSVTPR